MFIKIRYQDGWSENVFAWVEPDRVLKEDEWLPGWRVATPQRSSPTSDFFETTLNELGARSGIVTAEKEVDSFEWRLKGSEAEYTTIMMSSWVRNMSPFDPTGKPDGYADLDENVRRRFDDHQRCWLHYLPDPAATMEKIVLNREQARLSKERMDALDETTKRYLFGWCAQFAAALHLRTGWTMYGIQSPGSYGEAPSHVVCRMPDGLYADVRGLGQSAAQICEGYVDEVDEFTLRPVAMSEMLARFKREPDALQRAHDDVEAVLPAHETTAPILAIDIERDGSLYRLRDARGGRLRISDLDLSEMAEFLGEVPELKDFAIDLDEIEFRLDFEEEAGRDRSPIALGWIESMLVAAAEGATMPRKGVRCLTLPGVEVPRSSLW